MKRLSLNSAIEHAAAGMQAAALGKRYIATVQSVTDRETTGWVICDVFFRDPAAEGRQTVRVNASVDLAADDLIYIKHDPSAQKTFAFDGFVKGGGTGNNNAGAFVPWTQAPGATSPVGSDYTITPAAGQDVIVDGVNWSTFAALEFVLMTADGAVANERVLTAGDGISLADGGGGGAATLAVDLVAAWSGLEFNGGELQVDLDAVFDFASDVSVGGQLSVGTITPNYDFEVYAPSGQADIALSGASVNQPATDIAAANVAARIGANSSTTGGLYVRALSDTDATAMILAGIMGTADPTDTTPAIILRSHKSDGGTAVVALAAAETVLQVQNHLTNLVTFLGGGKVLINDIEDANITIGLSINQGANDNAIQSWKSSDVAHGITDLAETDTYGKFEKSEPGSGGLSIWGFKDGDENPIRAVEFTGVLGEAANTTKSAAAGFGIVSVRGFVQSGTNITTPGADANLMSIGSGNTIRFIFDQEGEMHSDAIIGVGNDWDDWDDLVLAADLSRLPKAKYDEMLAYRAKDFERAGLVTLSVDEHGQQHAFIRHKAMLMFSMNCFREVHQRMQRYEHALVSLGVNLLEV